MSGGPGPEDLPAEGGALDPELVEIAHACFDLARAGETERLDLYVEHGLPANLTDADGNTLLMLATYHGHADTVAMLLRRGADPDRLNGRGQSPVAGALFKGEDEVVRLLVEAGADLDAGVPTARQAAEMFGRANLLDT